MKAMVFAAGLGTRLKPFTDHHPKALAEINGTPILGLVINKLISYGVNEIIVNVHHFADQIIDYLKSNDDFGVKIHISDETNCLLDTGGGILAAQKYLDGNEPFIVHNADILTDFNLNGMLKQAVEKHADATLLVAERTTKRYLLFDPNNFRMMGWTNIETGEIKPQRLNQDLSILLQRAFGGVHIISPRIFPFLADFASKIDEYSIPKFSITDFYISFCSELNIFGYEPEGKYRWHDIGKPSSLQAANSDFK